MQKDVMRLKALLVGVRDAVKAWRFDQKELEGPDASASPELMPLHPSVLP